MSAAEVLLLIAAGIGGGAVNSTAGGGSLVTFPALLAVGLSPLAANVTSAVAIPIAHESANETHSAHPC